MAFTMSYGVTPAAPLAEPRSNAATKAPASPRGRKRSTLGQAQSGVAPSPEATDVDESGAAGLPGAM